MATMLGAPKKNTSTASVAPTKSYSAPLQRKVATPTYSAPARSYSSSSSSGGSSGGGSSYSGSSGGSGSGGSAGSGDYSGGGGGFSGGAVAAPAPPPPPPPPVMEDITIPDPLADPTYQRQKGELARAKADFDAQQGLAKSQYDGNVSTNMRQMGWRQAVPRTGLRAMIAGAGNDGEGWDPRAQGTAYGSSFEGNEGDFAGRGLYNSGLYAQAQSNLTNDFNDRRSGVLTDQKNWQDTQNLGRRNFEGQQNSTDLAAQSDAIAAIAARLGVNIDQVSPGKSSVIQREKV